MKISIQQYKNTVTWEGECDSCLDDVINQIKGLLVAGGYHPSCVDRAFAPDEFEWFPQEDEVEDYLKSEGFKERKPNHGQESGLTPNWDKPSQEKPHPNAEPLRQALSHEDFQVRAKK